MAVKLLCLCLLLLLLLCPSQAKKQQCLSSASTCDECIQSGPKCAWCTEPHSNIRCHTSSGLRRAGCLKGHIYNPQGGVQVVQNASSTEPVNAKSVFLQPQELSLRLRPGVRQSFPLTIAMPTDQPITELTIDTSDLPVGVNITFSNIQRGNPLVVEVNVDAAQCLCDKDDSNQMQNRSGPWSVHITPRGFSLSLRLEIALECQCDCTRHRQENSLDCSGHGTLVCGHCECYESYIGKQCQTDPESFLSPNEDACRSGPNAPVCSGSGKCVDGYCECRKRENPDEKYFGRYCECDNFNCPYWNRRICGGHGRCECRRCLCDDGWASEDCSCYTGSDSCMATNQMLCNGRGTCMCGTCKCYPPYAGPTCEECPDCLGPCQEHAKCVECRTFGTGAEKQWCDRECSSLNMTIVETKNDLTGPVCKMRGRHDWCVFYFGFSRFPSGGQLTVARDKDCPHN